MHTLHHDDAHKKSWSFISEDSFSAPASDVPLDALPWEQFPDSDDSDTDAHIDFAPDVHDPHTNHSERSRSRGSKRKRTVTFQDGIPVVSRKSSLPEPVHLLQEPLSATRRHTWSTSGGFHTSGLDHTNRTSDSVFNHTLYGSLRSGPTASLFARDYCGLAVSAAASGFLVPFLAQCVHPLLCAYLSLNAEQTAATLRYIQLPGITSVVIGVVSDGFPLWNLHRKAYMLLGWIVAYVALMALVLVAMRDYSINEDAPSLDSWTRFYGGAVYIALLLTTSFGVTIASVTAFALVVELSQREPLHERGALILTFLTTREVASLLATIVMSQVLTSPSIRSAGSLDALESIHSSSVISLKVLLLLLAGVALVPLPFVLFRLDEDRRQLKVDRIDRQALASQLWLALQHDAVWRLLLFIGLVTFSSQFAFAFATRAVVQFAGVDASIERIAALPHATLTIVGLLTFRYLLLNYSWRRVAAGGMVAGVVVHAAMSLPIVLSTSLRSVSYYVVLHGVRGFFAAASLIVTTLPLVEVTETGLEGATTGLVATASALLQLVLLSTNDWFNASTFVRSRFSAAAIANDAIDTRESIAAFLLLQFAINMVVLVPMRWLLPRQKLDAQQLRTYGKVRTTAGVSVVLVFCALAVFAAVVNVLALMHKLGGNGVGGSDSV